MWSPKIHKTEIVPRYSNTNLHETMPLATRGRSLCVWLLTLVVLCACVLSMSTSRQEMPEPDHATMFESCRNRPSEHPARFFFWCFFRAVSFSLSFCWQLAITWNHFTVAYQRGKVMHAEQPVAFFSLVRIQYEKPALVAGSPAKHLRPTISLSMPFSFWRAPSAPNRSFFSSQDESLVACSNE